jgi:hypothetical protein
MGDICYAASGGERHEVHSFLEIAVFKKKTEGTLPIFLLLTGWVQLGTEGDGNNEQGPRIYERGSFRMAHPPRIAAGASVLVVVRTDNSYDVQDGTLFLPEGTRLIGSWLEDQPGDGSAYAVDVGEITWHFPVESVTVSPLAEHVRPQEEQERSACTPERFLNSKRVGRRQMR